MTRRLDPIINPDNRNLLKYVEDYFDLFEIQPGNRKKAIDAAKQLIRILGEFDGLLRVDEIRQRRKPSTGPVFYVYTSSPGYHVLDFNVKSYQGSIDFRTRHYAQAMEIFPELKQLLKGSDVRYLNLSQYPDEAIIKAISEYIRAILNDDLSHREQVFKVKSKPQWFIYDLIKKYFVKDKIYYDYKPDFLKKYHDSGYSGNREIDIYNADLQFGIENQGQQHYQFIRHFHRHHDAFIELQKRDEWKRKKCEENSVSLLCIKNDTVTINLMRMPIEEAKEIFFNLLHGFLNSSQRYFHWDDLNYRF